MELAEERLRQVNIRIDEQVKAQGDAVLRRRGLTPSQGIRSFYACISADDERSRSVLALITNDVDNRASSRSEKLEDLKRFQAWSIEKFAEIGLPISAAETQLPDDSVLREQVYLERFSEVHSR